MLLIFICRFDLIALILYCFWKDVRPEKVQNAFPGETE